MRPCSDVRLLYWRVVPCLIHAELGMGEELADMLDFGVVAGAARSAHAPITSPQPRTSACSPQNPREVYSWLGQEAQGQLALLEFQYV